MSLSKWFLDFRWCTEGHPFLLTFLKLKKKLRALQTVVSTLCLIPYLMTLTWKLRKLKADTQSRDRNKWGKQLPWTLPWMNKLLFWYSGKAQLSGWSTAKILITWQHKPPPKGECPFVLEEFLKKCSTDRTS